MGRVIPIKAKRTTEQWLIAVGFQKLKMKGGGFLFKKGELQIQHFAAINGSETWYRVTMQADGTTYYSGIPNKSGYSCDYQHEVVAFYKYIHEKELASN